MPYKWLWSLHDGKPALLKSGFSFDQVLLFGSIRTNTMKSVIITKYGKDSLKDPTPKHFPYGTAIWKQIVNPWRENSRILLN